MTTLKLGSKGAEVKTLQTALNKACPYGLTVDGVFGKKTEDGCQGFSETQ